MEKYQAVILGAIIASAVVVLVFMLIKNANIKASDLADPEGDEEGAGVCPMGFGASPAPLNGANGGTKGQPGGVGGIGGTVMAPTGLGGAGGAGSRSLERPTSNPQPYMKGWPREAQSAAMVDDGINIADPILMATKVVSAAVVHASLHREEPQTTDIEEKRAPRYDYSRDPEPSPQHRSDRDDDRGNSGSSYNSSSDNSSYSSDSSSSDSSSPSSSD